MKKLVLGVVIIFTGTISITSCSSDSTVLSQFSKRKYMKNFNKSNYKQKEVIDEYQYADAAAEIETTKFNEVILDEAILIDNADLILTTKKTNTISLTKVASSEKDYSSWSNYNRDVEIGESIIFHDAKESKASTLTISSSSSAVDDVVLIILGIFIPPLAVYLYEDSISTNFWVDLILCLLFWIPGIVFAFLVMFGGLSL